MRRAARVHWGILNGLNLGKFKAKYSCKWPRHLDGDDEPKLRNPVKNILFRRQLAFHGILAYFDEVRSFAFRRWRRKIKAKVCCLWR
jgi:hypothetical protein